jgi:hypothetical protein
MPHAMTADKLHAIGDMIAMYESVCTQMRTLKDDARVVSVYALYDCVSLILAYMLKPYPTLDVKTYNAKQLQMTTNAIDEQELNRKFIDFDKDFYGTVYLDTAMSAVKFDDCQKHLFWRKVQEHLTRKSLIPEIGITSEMSFDPDYAEYASEATFDHEKSTLEEQSFDPERYADGDAFSDGSGSDIMA